MLYYDRIDISKGLDRSKSNRIKECMICHYCFFPETLKYWVGVQRGHSFLMGRRCLFSLGCHPSDGVTIKIPYGVDVLHQPALHPIFSYWVG